MTLQEHRDALKSYEEKLEILKATNASSDVIQLHLGVMNAAREAIKRMEKEAHVN